MLEKLCKSILNGDSDVKNENEKAKNVTNSSDSANYRIIHQRLKQLTTPMLSETAVDVSGLI